VSEVRRSWFGALRALHIRLLLPVLLVLLVAVGALLGSAAFVGLLGLSPSLQQSGSSWLGLGLPALASAALVLGGLPGLVLAPASSTWRRPDCCVRWCAPSAAHRPCC
jgi:hypothetical protein